MSAYKEKELAEKKIEELNTVIKDLEFQLREARLLLVISEEDLAEAEQGIKWEAENDR